MGFKLRHKGWTEPKMNLVSARKFNNSKEWPCRQGAIKRAGALNLKFDTAVVRSSLYLK